MLKIFNFTLLQLFLITYIYFLRATDYNTFPQDLKLTEACDYPCVLLEKAINSGSEKY